jgi:uncharacterized protein with HEPN domain
LKPSELRLRLDRMRDSAETVLQYAEVGRNAFFDPAQKQLRDAIFWRISNLTEEAERLYRPLQRHNPGINWRELTRERQLFHHDYSRITLNETWNFIQRDLPRLLAKLRRAKLPVEE